MSDEKVKVIPIELHVYTLQETADTLKVSTKAIRNWIKAGKLKATKIGREYRIQEQELKRVLDEGI